MLVTRRKIQGWLLYVAFANTSTPDLGRDEPSNEPVISIPGPAVTAVSCGVIILFCETNVISCGSFNRKQKPPYPFSSFEPPSCKLSTNGFNRISKSKMRYWVVAG